MAARNIEILWIAPDDGKAAQLNIHEHDDISRIRGVTVTSLAGRAATTTAIADALSTPGADIIIWSGHGNEDGLLASDGRHLGGEWIATQVRLGMPELFVLGACYSSAAGRYLEQTTALIAEAGVNAAGFLIAADDEAATLYVCELVRALAAGADHASANRVAKRAAASINRETAASVDYHAAVLDGNRTILRELREIREMTDKLSETTNKLSERVLQVETGQDALMIMVEQRFPEVRPRNAASTTRSKPRGKTPSAVPTSA